MTDTLQYVLMRVIYADDMITLMKLSGQAKEEFIHRHYSSTVHGLAALGLSNEDIDYVLKEVERRWKYTSRDGDAVWPYPSRLAEGGVKSGS